MCLQMDLQRAQTEYGPDYRSNETIKSLITYHKRLVARHVPTDGPSTSPD